ncbi:MAG: phosphoadenosine phosphosulfate reductase family protein, partial [Staphylothermus sp.]|nr:phosphoadenosine phosphosulfate reductase family protein [Staphylothermus sp.]
MYWMYRVIPDDDLKDIVEKTISKYYGRWMHLSSKPYPYSYNIYMRECNSHHLSFLSSTDVEICVSRNEKLDLFMLARLIEHARAMLRNYVVWRKDTYVFGIREGNELEEYSIHPAYDVYFGSPGLIDLLQEKFRINLPKNALISKRFGGKHYIYSGEKPKAIINIPDEGINIFMDKYNSKIPSIDIDFDKILIANREYLLRNIMISKNFLKSLGKPDIVLVSFSGGKDSLVVLHMVREYYGPEIVRGIYVDTGVDFPTTREYVEKISEYLDVKIDIVRADIDKLINIRKLPTKENRWCTLRKTRAFKKKLEEYKRKYDKVLVIVGDRDAESEARARKPPVRRRGKYLEAAPIKQWSTALVQLYILNYGLPNNPLYGLGFYRLGCYICPALTSLERIVMNEKLYKELKNLKWFKEYIEY